MNITGEAREKLFWDSMDKSNECWVWNKTTNAGGYGIVRFQGETKLAHRVAWELVNGQIPERLGVLHSCDTPACCNPDHLRLGNDSDNHADQMERGRHQYAFRDECSNGHPYTEENTRIIERGSRTYRGCRACTREYTRKYRERQRSAA